MIASTGSTWERDSNGTRQKNHIDIYISMFEKVCVYVIWWFDCTRCACSAQNKNQTTHPVFGRWWYLINTKCYTRFAARIFNKNEIAWWRINGRRESENKNKHTYKSHTESERDRGVWSTNHTDTDTDTHAWRQNGVWSTFTDNSRNKSGVGDVCFLFWFLPVCEWCYLLQFGTYPPITYTHPNTRICTDFRGKRKIKFQELFETKRDEDTKWDREAVSASHSYR